MSFQQKRALVSLVAIWIAAVSYTARAWRSPPASLAEAVGMLAMAAIGLTVVMILAHIVLAIGAGAEEARRPADAGARKARAAARRNAAWTLVLGLGVVGGLQRVSVSAPMLAQAAAAVLVLAQMVFYGSELIGGRRRPSSPQLL